MEVRAKQVSEEFLKLPADGRYQVHSCYEHGFNLLLDEKFCFVGNKHNELLPYGILLDDNEMDRIQGKVIPGDTVFFRDSDRKRMISARLKIRFDGAEIFTSRYAGINAGTKPVRKGQASTSPLMAAHSMPLGTGEEIFAFLGKEMTGFGISIEDMVSGKGKRIQGLTECFQCADEKKIQNILETWVGYGPGLTPSGDDFLLGILFADQMFSFLGETFKRGLEALANTFYTTAVSVSQYLCAFQSLFCSSFLEFSKGWEDGDRDVIKDSLRCILKFGHTSGRDMAAGLIIGIQYAQIGKNPCI